MFLSLKISKEKLSSYFLFLFFVILSLGYLGSEFFQAPLTNQYDINKYRTLLEENLIERTQSLTIDNRIGKFEIEKEQENWTLKSPRKLPASEIVIRKVFDTLSAIKIKKIYEKDAINLSNFSLDSPLTSINLHFFDGEKMAIKFGLINPIDNSTYITLESKKAIYHIDTLPYAIEKFDLPDFIDSRVFPIKKVKLASINILKGKKKSLHLKQKEKKWFNQKEQELEPERVDKFINELLSIRTSLIIDSMDEKLEKQIAKYLKKPLYTIEINDNSEQKYVFEVSPLVRSLHNIKIEKRSHFIIRSSHSEYPYIIHKDKLKVFSQRQSSFKKLPFKKLFY